MSEDKKIEDILAQAPPVSAQGHVQTVIPPHVAANILEFLRRVKSEGMEAIAWVEAYSLMQQHAPQQGVPFTGLPPKKPA